MTKDRKCFRCGEAHWGYGCPKDFKVPDETLTHDKPLASSKDVVQRCPHGISLTANPACHFCDHERLINGFDSLKGAHESLCTRFVEKCKEMIELRTALNRIREEEQELHGVSYHIAADALSGDRSGHETAAPQNMHSDEWWQAELDRCVGVEQAKYRALFAAYSELKAGDPDVTAGVRPAVEPTPPHTTLDRIDWKARAEAAEGILNHNMALANATTRKVMDERNAIIRKLRDKYSAIEVAEQVGLTRQRVHQILNEAPILSEEPDGRLPAGTEVVLLGPLFLGQPSDGWVIENIDEPRELQYRVRHPNGSLVDVPADRVRPAEKAAVTIDPACPMHGSRDLRKYIEGCTCPPEAAVDANPGDDNDGFAQVVYRVQKFVEIK